MPSYCAPIKDIIYVMEDVIRVGNSDVPGYQELDTGFISAILDESAKLAQDVLAPLNVVGDNEGCTLDNGVVRTPIGFKRAFEMVKSGGWTGLDCDPEYGGQGIPIIMASAITEMFSSANMAFSMYQGLTHGAYSAIHTHGSEEQKNKFLPNMVSCHWTGTMNLTEPHCGTDLGLMRTKAIPEHDGSYTITGQKIFISAGDHDLAENIIHLVLAKIEGAPSGTRGVSLFIVPKYLIKDDGTLGQRNGLSVGRIEDKMGIHGNATCLMNYDGAVGYLLGEPHKGLRAMFTMMNEARLGVGIQGYAQAEVAYQNALEYSKERLQGRDATGTKNSGGPADPLIVHPDIRRNLMEQKSFVEGARAFTMWAATLIDRYHRLNDSDANGLVSLLIPVIKGFLTDKGFEMCVQAQQIYGGHGYIEEWGMSQFARDARIAMIYEGANGIQAIDLVGRKLGQDGGKQGIVFLDMVREFASTNQGQNAKFDKDFLEPLEKGSTDLRSAAIYFMQNGVKNPNHALAGSYDFMHMFGEVCLGLMWAKMAKASFEALENNTDDPAFHETKIATGQYYMLRQLPATAMHLQRILSGADPVMALEAANF